MSDSTGACLRWLAAGVALCAILILPVAWHASQGWIFPDTISYLDMASDALRVSPAALVKNAYWSPGYPAILAVMLAVVRPSAGAEIYAVYVVHWLMFLVTAICFSVLLRTVVRWLGQNSWPELARDSAQCKAFVAFAYAFFLLCNMSHIIWHLTPDMLLQGVAYLAAALAIRLFLPGSCWKYSAALGVTLGLGYLIKAAMFPIGLMLIGLLFLKPPKDRWARRYAVVAMACFCMIAAPQVISLSLEKHRLTTGDAGKLNYAFVVSGPHKFSGWVGQDPGFGTPAHAPRAISMQPMILEFRAPVSGTEPLWYDPSYWWEGLRIPITVRSEVAGILRPFRIVHSKQSILLALAAALAPLCLLSLRVRQAIRAGGVPTWLLLVWPALACLMYALVLFSIRYVLAYIVMAGVSAAAIVLPPFPSGMRRKALIAAVLLLAAVGVVTVRPILAEALHPNEDAWMTRADGPDDVHTSLAAAQGLDRLGIHHGDEIGVVGEGLDCYYARLAGVRIVAQIWENPDDIQGLSAPDVQRILAQLKQVGVKALVSRVKPGFVNDKGWSNIPRTDIYVRML